jgi:hypothetical protein
MVGAEAEDHPPHLLRQATQVSEEEEIDWIYKLRDEHAEIFKQVAEQLVIPLEINAVFRKAA